MEYGTRLPPRKRLLAGMKRQNCDEPWLRFHSDELRTRVREVLEFRYATAEEFVEASKSVALSAEKAAAEARSEAKEKAENAAKAKAFARSVLEAVVYGSGGCDGRPPAQSHGRKKRVAVDILYSKADQFGGSCADDEEMARRLHRVMNSPPRRTSGKKLGNVVKLDGLDGEVVNGGNVAVVCSGSAEATCSSSADKENRRSSVKSKTSLPPGDGDKHKSEKTAPNTDAVPANKKGKVKKMKILLSQFSGTGSENSKVAPDNACHLFSGGSSSSLLDSKHSNAAKTSEETESLWKRKKMKLSQFYPEGKISGSKQEATWATVS